MTMQIAGRYSFLSQEHFEEFLKADNAGMLMRNMVAAAKPDMVIEINGDNYKITSITNLKSMRTSFTLGQAYEYESEYKKSRRITTLEGGDTLLSKNVEDVSSTSSMKFTNDEMIITMTTNGVTATRTFKRA